MPFELNTSFPVNVPRTGGHSTLGYYQRVLDGNTSVLLAWTDEHGVVTGKVVPLKQFVEFNPEYAYLLPVVQHNTITFTFSPEQIEAFRQCPDCPPCFLDI